MRHFNGLTDSDLKTFFKYSPTEFNSDTDREILSLALGAALYTPGSRADFAQKILTGEYSSGIFAGLTTLIVCLEDAVADTELKKAEENTISEFKKLAKASTEQLAEGPALFLRIRTPEQLDQLIDSVGTSLRVLTGIVFPKCSPTTLPSFFEALDRASNIAGRKLYALPLLETKEVLYSESREKTLSDLYDIIKSQAERVLTVRVGATDFSSLYGLRRPADRTIYEVHIIRDCLIAIMNRFGRSEDGFTVSGPVYEHFSSGERLWLSSKPERTLWEEVQLDILNGFKGKTCIHPSQISIVNTSHIVSLEAYEDAKLILEESNKRNGVLKSLKRNKMNEVKPHLSWAKKVVAQAEVYGVLNENYQPIDVLNHIRANQLSNQH
ncbi:HpcH/HpaI aldolase/citrate lyase family protein [Planococcus versutus]|uniref:Citrate lyase beta chain n=1 Tax=Planococcus versutus TaxID=1302659 RepID=A0A1B1S260_9BACL|nr:HpcH/HpaI aldolase/citrate lyase family protein [Planococcus versutus]ANU27275.1 citrate lyase beta chain [Planococcus versutus]